MIRLELETAQEKTKWLDFYRVIINNMITK